MNPSPLPRPDEPLTLPRAPEPAARPPIPVLSAIVPVVGAVVLWLVTGSAYALLFALLGPLIALASVADAARGARRSRRRATLDAEAAVTAARGEVARRHDAERAVRWARHPDVAGFLGRPESIWRPVPEREDRIVVGAGDGDSEVRVTGGDGDPTALEMRRGAAVVASVPVLVPLTAGIAVIGPPALAAALARGLALQACLCLAPGRLRLADDAPAWMGALPHSDAASGMLLELREGGGLVGADVDVPIVVVPEGDPPPPRCGAVLRLTGPTTARLDTDGQTRDVEIETVSVGQAEAAARLLADRAERALGRVSDAATTLDDLLASAPPARPDALSASFASSGSEPFPVDLVSDGPHAVVIGVTGSGKSELLTSWVAALCAAHSPQQLGLLLVDFKGGRTFDHLLPLPHVTGVLTDLDEATAIRAIESLRAEVRHRERALSRSGAKDVAEPGHGLGRLVIVVDEYAALVAAHPDLHDVFGDLAARGRALGIHLVLAAQRAAGVFRDAVLANAPLRIALRVTDAADSRAVLGVDDASRLSGRPHAKGVALVRRGGDSAPCPVRVARCAPETLARIAARQSGPPARAPWLPALPPTVSLHDLPSGGLVLGLADEPERQWQGPLLWPDGEVGMAVLGARGTGRTSILRTIAAQTPSRTIPRAAEGAWDALSTLEEVPSGTTVIIDDLDAVMAGLPGEYAPAALASLEAALRSAHSLGIRVVVSAQRLTGPTARFVDLLPRRILLGFGSRADHVAAGGEAGDHIIDLPPGRGRFGRTLVQFALPDAAPSAVTAPEEPPRWHPGRRPAAVVVPAGPRGRRIVAGWERLGIPVTQVESAGSLRRGCVVVGSAEAWLAQWRLLAEARADADLVVDASCSAEYRALSGVRELPPFALPGAGRAWLHAPDRGVRRVVLAEG